MIADLKPYLAMKESSVPWLGEMPEHWDTSKIKGLARPGYKTFVDGDWIESPYITTDGIRLIQTGNIGTGEYREKGFRYISEETFTNFCCTEIKPGDILICRLGEPVSRACLAPQLGKRMITSVDVCILKARENIHAKFLVYSMSSLPYLDWVGSLVRGSTRDRVSRSMLGSFLLPLPPLPEQAAIVRYLDHADRRIRRYIRAKQKLIALLEEQRQAVVHEAVTGQIDVRTGLPYPAYKPSGVEWLGDVPEHWEVRRLKSKLRPVDRRSSSGAETLLSLRRDLGVVVYAEHFSRPPQGATLVGYKLVEAGQLVINRLQANNGLLFCSGLSGVVSPDYSVFAPRSPVDMEYLGNLLRTVTYKAYFRRESTGLGTGSAGFLRLYDDRLLATPVALPPLEEQSTLLVSLSEITASLCRAIGRQHVEIGLLREYRTRLIADVVTGKLDVRESAAGLPEVDPLADKFDAPTQSTETGVVELNDTTEFPEELAMENEVII